MKRLLILCAVLALAGCDPAATPERIAGINSASFKSPETVGQLPDGRDVVRYKAYVSCSGCQNGIEGTPHYVYVVGNVVSDNYQVHVGRSRQARVGVSIGSAANEDKVLAAAKKIEAEREAADKAEWERLNGKYGGAK